MCNVKCETDNVRSQFSDICYLTLHIATLLSVCQQLAQAVNLVRIKHALVGLEQLPDRGFVNFHFQTADPQRSVAGLFSLFGGFVSGTRSRRFPGAARR